MAEAVRPSLAGRPEAERFVAAMVAGMAALEEVLARETECLKAGRIREGLGLEAEKSRLAAAYLRDLETLKANAVALGRFAPDAVAGLRRANEGFRAAVARNQAVVATARSVSEGLVRTLSEELSKRTRPASYGAGPRPARPASAQPLAYSARL